MNVSTGFVLELTRLEVDAEHGGRRSIGGSGTWTCGSFAVTLDEDRSSRSWSWAITNRGPAAAVRSVALVFRVLGEHPLQMLRHGYQSWSACDLAIFGHDHDPSVVAGDGLPPLAHGCFHADERPVSDPHELRSELYTVVLAGWSHRAPVAFIAFTELGVHDATLRLRPDGSGGAALWVEAFLGDAELAAGASLTLQPFVTEVTRRDGAMGRVERWCTALGERSGARVGAEALATWSSWYHWFTTVTEGDVARNASALTSWDVDVIQVDDGYQAAIGDWLMTNDSFPSGLAILAEQIRATGRRAGLWIAPFLVAPGSQVATVHPEWLARQPDGSPLLAMFNPIWGGDLGGLMYALDTTHPDVLDHLERTAARMRALGFTYLKLDFTFAPSLDGVWSNRAMTPLQRVRAGFDAVRRGAGEDTFIVGCGAPLAAVVGVVDALRVGPDVSPSWAGEVPKVGAVDQGPPELPGYERSAPSTRNACANTLARSFMHRRLWINDPDCLMLRRDDTALTLDQIVTWSRTVAGSGGMLSVSDDVSRLGPEEQRSFATSVERRRRVDRDARDGRVPTCPDLLLADGGWELRAGTWSLIIEPTTGTSIELDASLADLGGPAEPARP